MVDEIPTHDRRRVTAAGRVQRPSKHSRPNIGYKDFKFAAENAWHHINTHLDRNIRSRTLRPEATWGLIWGLALSARQTYNAIALLLADRIKPNTLPLPASVLVRGLFECLGNVMAL